MLSKFKPIKKMRQEIEELDAWDDDYEVTIRESVARELAISYFKVGYDEMAVYRQLGLKTDQDWEWLRFIKENSCDKK